MTDPVSFIFCEGYDDRAFWAGWLKHRGFTKPADGPSGFPEDNWGPIKAGQFGFRNEHDSLRLRPVEGIKQIKTAVREVLKMDSTDRPLGQIILSIDDDRQAGDDVTSPPPAWTAASLASTNEIKPYGYEVVSPTTLRRPASGQTIQVVRWYVAAEHSLSGVPRQQTLERLVCTALAQTYPTRAEAVEQWLASRPEPPADTVKAAAWSHMAGWYPDGGCQWFYERLWDHASLAAALETLLEACGATAVLEAFLTA